jgi:hypothetical protein
VNCFKNREVTQKLFELIESGNGILFIGLGSSLRLKYPSWEEVLRNLNQLVKGNKVKDLVERKINNEELLLAAEIIKNNVEKQEFEKKMQKLFSFKSPTHDALHQQLVKLKFKAFVTTNYDPVIEAALRSVQNQAFNCDIVISETTKKNIHQLFKSLSSLNWKERHHLYLHGKFSYPSTMILSYGDYAEKYDGIIIKNHNHYKDLVSGKLTIEEFEDLIGIKNLALRTLHYKTAYLLMATQRVVYLGYGLRDPYLKKITDDIQDDFQTFYDDYHYALMSSNYAKNWDEKEYIRVCEEWILKGIELVFYEDNESYTGIDDFVRQLSPNCFLSNAIDNMEKNQSMHLNSKELSKHPEDENVNQKLEEKMKILLKELKKNEN